MALLERRARTRWSRRAAARRSRPVGGLAEGHVPGPIVAQGAMAGRHRGRAGRGVCLRIEHGPRIGLRYNRRRLHRWAAQGARIGPALAHRQQAARSLPLARAPRLRPAPERARREIRHLGPSILPREAEARKPEPLATKGQAQQQRVAQQGEQQPKRQTPAFRLMPWLSRWPWLRLPNPTIFRRGVHDERILDIFSQAMSPASAVVSDSFSARPLPPRFSAHFGGY